MSVTYPQSQKPNPYPKAVLAPTPELRAKAAVDEAIGHFRSVARAGGMIALFLLLLLSNIVDAEGNWMLVLIVGLGVLSVSLSLSAVDLRQASQRPKFLSGLSEGGQKFDVFHWLRWAAFIGATAGGVICLIWHRELGLSRSDGLVLCPVLLIVGQLVLIVMETIQGVKLLRFAKAATDEVAAVQTS